MITRRIFSALAAAPPVLNNWPAFRGRDAAGVADGAVAPAAWNADADHGPAHNILLKTPLPGLSHSSPILWQDTLYEATAVARAGAAPLKVGLYGASDSADDKGEQAWKIYALDRATGKQLSRNNIFI